jgi:hypothetical protein
VSQADEEKRLPPGEEAELLALLEAALRPSELDPGVNERLIERALEDPLAPPSPEELVESARLRDALALGTEDDDARVLRALQASFGGVSEDDDAARRAVDRALGSVTKPKRSNVVYAVFGAASAVVAAAAAALLLFGTLSRSASAPAAGASAPTAALVKPHSTAPLFEERFETGDTSARMDLIASARSRELRDNRYATWGVR